MTGYVWTATTSTSHLGKNAIDVRPKPGSRTKTSKTLTHSTSTTSSRLTSTTMKTNSSTNNPSMTPYIMCLMSSQMHWGKTVWMRQLNIPCRFRGMIRINRLLRWPLRLLINSFSVKVMILSKKIRPIRNFALPAAKRNVL